MADETFGARLKRLREEAGLTQQQFADLTGIHKVSISRLEQDEYGPSWATVQSFAKALGTNCLAFEGTIEPPKPEDKAPGKRGRPRKSPPTPDVQEAESAPEPEVKPKGKRKPKE